MVGLFTVRNVAEASGQNWKAATKCSIYVRMNEKLESETRQKISPSQFMRELRPEYYSDTSDRITYVLDQAQFEYHLNTLTSRNQTHDFEIFCRKLCERAVCPNLRAQTGPDGGGDSKADAETFHVADEISALYFEGEPGSGRARWAFAFSANAKWKDKARADVEGIVATGRQYDRIICVTSRFAKSKTRADLEDELSKEFCVQVTIHDRTWVVTEVIERDRKDIAYNYLKVGEVKSDPLRLGPRDYSRLRQLEDIETEIDDASRYSGMKIQRAAEALIAARLSRGLERGRTEVEGRFLRAIRLADDGGTFRQRLEAQYELIWTAFWWYDDIQLVNSAYDPFEKLLGKDDHALNVEFLCSLFQLLVNGAIHRLLPCEQLQLAERSERLRVRLEGMASDTTRPNNSLEGETFLVMLRMNKALLEDPRGSMSDIWSAYGEIVERATGLGEFDARKVTVLIEAAAQIAGNDPEYTALIEKLSTFVAERTGEAEGALVLLRRAQKMDFDQSFDMIRILGRAAMALTKKEHTEDLVDCLLLLSLAYRSAGLLWAARSTCIFAVASIVILGEEDSEIPVTIVPAMKLLAWITLELCHIPDFLLAVNLLNGAARTLPLTEDSRKNVDEAVREFDMAAGSIFLNFGEDQLRLLGEVPDILNALGMWSARTALLYAMGYLEVLRADQSIPNEETDEGAREMMSILASQPVGEITRPLLLNRPDGESLSTTILGMQVEVATNGSDRQINIGEAVLAILEATFATLLEHRIAAHAERIEITIVEKDGLAKPEFDFSGLDMVGILRWPSSLTPNDFVAQDVVQRSLFEMAAHVLRMTCFIPDLEKLLTKLLSDEAIQQRIAISIASLTSYRRVTRRATTRLSTWSESVKQSLELKHPLPTVDRTLFAEARKVVRAGSEAHDGLPDIRDHREVKVRSVIDLHGWDQARWRGLGYGYIAEDMPPLMMMLFEDEPAARKLFERWRERVGSADIEGEIRVCIVRHLPGHNPQHYCAIISAKLPTDMECDRSRLFMMANRSMVMEPADDTNLSGFLERFGRHRAYILMPALLQTDGLELIKDLPILKWDLVIREASDISENDMDSVAFLKRESRE